MSKICPLCHKLIFDSNISTVVGTNDYCSCAANINYLSVDQNSHFFTTLEQIHDCLLSNESKDWIRKAIKNTITNGYVLRSKDECDVILPGYKIVKDVRVVPYQLCPKCYGTGQVMNNQIWGNTMSISTDSVTCDVCNGAKIIPQYEIK